MENLENTTVYTYSDIKNNYEKIVTALYLVSGHLKDTEPMRSRIRHASHELFDAVVDLSDTKVIHIQKHTSHIQSLLSISSASSLIKSQNAGVLITALDKNMLIVDLYINNSRNQDVGLEELLNAINVANSDLSGGNLEQARICTSHEYAIDDAGTVPNNHLSRPEPVESKKAPAQTPQNNLLNTTLENPVNRQDMVRPGPLPKMSFNSVESMKRTFETINHTHGSALDRSVGNIEVNQGQPVLEYSQRQQSIMKELKNKGQLTIKDLSDKIRGCSEKTIQRELLSLVAQGVLKKEGERRWSKYSLN